MKIDVFNYPTLVWRPVSREPLRISTQTLCPQKLESMPSFLPPTVWVYLHSVFCGGLRKTHLFWNRMPIGRSRLSKVVDFDTNRKGVCDFLLVINSNFGPILHRFWDTVSYWLKNANFSYPTLVWRPRSGGIRQNFWMKLTGQKLEGWGCCTVKIAWS